MKARKLFLALLMLLITAIAVTAVACQPTPEPVKKGEEGPETGAYYCVTGSDECVLIFNDFDQFTLVVKNESKSGTYKITDGDITFTFDSRYEGETITNGRYETTYVTLTYDNLSLKFWKDIKYTVTFDAGEGSTVTEKVRNGKSISAPADPAKEGYVFTGWFKENGTPFGFDAEPVTGDLKLTAKWEEQIKVRAQEYTVKFNVGEYDGAVNPEAKTTVYGKLTGLETPERSGYKFGGWWVSCYEDGTKLSYRFNADEEIKQNLTLFAVWTPESSNALLPEVAGNTIVWNGISSVSAYNVIIEMVMNDGTTRTVFSKANISETRLEYNWEEETAGDYIVTVKGGSFEEKSYYRNKALDRVSLFSISGTTLKYNKVDNAERYYLTIVCGDEDHEHDMLNNGASATYNFANCPMKDGKISFKVTATATGYADSVSEEFVCEKMLAPVTEYEVDEDNQIVTWSDVENATGYKVEMKCDNASHNHMHNRIDTKIDYKECESGDIVINITPIAKGYGSPDYTQIKINKKVPATPSEIKVTGSKITWNKVEGATYKVCLGKNIVRSVNTEEFDLSAEYKELSTGFETSVSVIAVKGNAESKPSDEVKVIYNVLDSTLRYMGSTLYWTHVGGSASYVIRVNGKQIEEKVVGVNHQKITLTKEGKNIISISFFDEFGIQSAEATIEVMANRVILNSDGGDVDEVLYKVPGDDMTDLPVPHKNGYTFGGWYNVPGGASSNGEKYDDVIFGGQGDIELYANWQSNGYKVKFMVDEKDILGTLPQDLEVKFGKEFTLPVPQNADKRIMFVAWTFKDGDLTSRVCDGNGNGLKLWNRDDVDEDGFIRLYPSWAQVLEFSLNVDETGFTARKDAAGIQKVQTVTIPAMYTDPITKKTVPVVAVGDFSGSPIETLNIPNTVQTININSNAFEGCDRLTTINLYEPEDKDEALFKGPYVSYDGNIVKINEITDIGQGSAQLVYVPRGITGRYTIPVGVDSVDYRAAKDSKFTELVISAGVKFIGEEAFANCTNLRTIIIEENSNSEQLELSRGAFSGCTSLRDIRLPARVKLAEGVTFSEVFEGCSNTKSINISTNHAEYVSEGGIVYSKNKQDLIYCPTGITGDRVIASGVINIAKRAFYGIKGITSVTFPNTVQNIGESAFENCSSLKKVTLSRELITIGDNAFCYCRNLETVDFSACTVLKTIGKKAFAAMPSNKEALYDVTYKNDNLRDIQLPQSVVSIGDKAFYRCFYAVSELDLPVCESIGENAFAACETIQKVVLGSVKKIGNSAFSMESSTSGIVSIKYVDLGSKLESIGEKAFYRQSAINRIFVPETLTEVGAEAFSGCGNVYEICNKSNVGLGVSAFYTHDGKDSRIETVDGKFVFYLNATAAPADESEEQPAQATAVLLEYIGNESEVVLPNYYKENITYTIRNRAFLNNTLITKLTIGSGVTAIESGAFTGCIMIYEVYNLSNVSVTTAVVPNVKYVYDSVDAESKFKTENGFIFSVSDTAVELVGYAGDNSTVVLPDYYGENRDYTITANTFKNKKVENLTIGKGVKTIPANLFKNNTTLRTLTVNGEGTAIKNDAFNKCTALTKVTLANVIEIGDNAFRYCYALESVNIPNTVTTLGKYAFEQCTSLVDLYIGTGVTELKSNTFAQCISLKEVIVPGNVKSVDACVFGACISLEKIKFEEGVEKFANRIFALPTVSNRRQYCPNLVDVTLPKSLTSIGTYTFEGCTSLTSVVATPGFNTITSYMYEDCTGLSEVVIPDNITTINANAFASCYNIKTVVIGEGVTTIDKSAFLYDSGIQIIYNLSKSDELNLTNETFDIGPSGTPKEVLFVPFIFDSLDASVEINTTDDGFVFLEADGRNILIDYVGNEQSLIMPYDYKGGTYEIGQRAFYNCEFTSVTLSGNTTKIGTGAFEAKTGEGKLRNVDIANGITEIGEFAFCGQNITSLRIPDSVQVIGMAAFRTNKNLTDLDLGNGVREIKDYAFNTLSSLKKLIIPDSVETIGANAFSSCTVLSQVTLGRSLKDIKDDDGNVIVPAIGANAFSSCGIKAVVNRSQLDIKKGKSTYGGVAQSAESVTTTDPETDVINDFTFMKLEDKALLMSYTGKATDIVFPEYNLSYSIPDYFFQENEVITSVVISNSVTAIGDKAFYKCPNLTSVVIGDGIKTIPDYEFQDCANLTSVTLGKGLTSIGKYAFQKTNIESLVIPSTVTTIGNNAFDACANLKSLKFEVDTVTNEDGTTKLVGVSTINNYAFRGTAIEHLVIPDTVTTLGAGAFQNIEALETLIIGDGVTSTGYYNFNKFTNLKWVVLGANVKTITQKIDGVVGTLTGYFVHAASADEWPGKAEISSKLNKEIKVYYYSEEKAEGFWHYDENNVPVLW